MAVDGDENMLKAIKNFQYGGRITIEKGKLYEVIDQDSYYVYINGTDYPFSYSEVKEYFIEISDEEIRENKKSHFIHLLYHNLNYISFRGENPISYEDRIEQLAELLVNDVFGCSKED